MTNRYRKTEKITKPHVTLVDNLLCIELPPDMYYIADALEVVLPAVLHKFAVHATKGDWLANGETVANAFGHLLSEVEELNEAIKSGIPENVVDEAADTINQAMILATIFKTHVQPERKTFEWFGRKFVARSDGEIEYANGIRAGQPVKFIPNHKGYYEVNMYGVNTPKGYKRMSRARTILFAFKGPPPSDQHTAEHVNTLVWDDRPSNLEWLPHNENSAQSGRANRGVKAQRRYDETGRSSPSAIGHTGNKKNV